MVSEWYRQDERKKRKKKSPRGLSFASAETKQRVTKLGGKSVVKKYGKAHMSELGKLSWQKNPRTSAHMKKLGSMKKKAK